MKKLSVEHQGRELVHVMGLLTRCLGIPGSTTATRDQWGRDLAAAGQKLEALHARGLRRDLPSAVPPSEAPATPGRPTHRATAPAPAGDAETGLMTWQKELVIRLERGLGRALGPGDARCIAWNLSAETMSVASQPLLDELRSNNLTSNVFRRRRNERVGPAPRR
jgi:hypothetical protein